MHKTVRTPAVAGMFYPAEAPALKTAVETLLETVIPIPLTTLPKAIIAPHAGYVYSGAIAASAYTRLMALRDKVERVILLGPSHRVPFIGLAASSATCFATPLGEVPLDQQAVSALLSLPEVTIRDHAHQNEHSLEVQLPFLQTIFDEFKIVPLLVGDARPQQVAAALDKLWGGEETVIIVSSDLSHYHDYDTARRMDKRTSQAIEKLDYTNIHYEQACGRNPINGLLYVAQQRALQATTIDLRNSGDTAGDKQRVVGYGAYALQ